MAATLELSIAANASLYRSRDTTADAGLRYLREDSALIEEKSITCAVSVAVEPRGELLSGGGMNCRSIARRPVGSCSSKVSMSVISMAMIGSATLAAGGPLVSGCKTRPG